MANTNVTAPASGKKNAYAKAGHGKDERIARELQHIVTFQHSLDKEIKKFEQAQAKHAEIDGELLKKMLKVKGHYQDIKSGFAGPDDDVLRHAFIVYADALQDLITHIYRRKN